uniref:Uncharacterized protein n=1 Tax=Clytia hemisphaerica TaxID=252671 RepID=A0A7M5UFC9_9CNID
MDGQKLKDLLQCAYCLERLDEKSKVLPCQHTFCTKCLNIIVENKGHLHCPECKSDFRNTNIDELPKNMLLLRILETLKNTNNKLRGCSDKLTEGQDEIPSVPKHENPKPKDAVKRISAKSKYQAQINQPCARGLHNFISNEEGDLPFKKGDVISLAHEIDTNWYEGFLGNKRGSIPKNFLETLVPLPKIEDTKVENPFAKALYSYENKEEPELISFREGDIIGVIKKVDNNWFGGILGGQYGIFPVNFVQLNKAAKEIMSGDQSSSATSSSDEENESSRKKTSRGRRVSRQKAASTSEPNAQSSCVRRDRGASTSNDPVTKRHTIHVENPDEQLRQSRRALNLSEDFEPQERTRAMSQGRRVNYECQQSVPRTLASTVLLSRALRRSDERLGINTSSGLTPTVSMTTSIPRATEGITRSLSTSPSNSIPNAIGTGEMHTALFTYSPARDDELALIQGDQYSVIEKHLDGWFKGVHVRSQQCGVFPGNYVKPSSQVSQQMLRSIGTHPSRAVIGYGSNPSSPNVPASSGPAFNFPPTRMDVGEDSSSNSNGATSSSISAYGENSSPKTSGMSGFMKIFKKNKTKRQTLPAPTTPQQPPSYYHSSMPGPIARPSPNVPAEPPPPYTPSPLIPQTIPCNSNLPSPSRE